MASAPAEPVAVVAALGGKRVHLKKGSIYYWCTCGRSKNQPFCDGSHKGTGFKPSRFVPTEDGVKSLCLCKRTRNPPYCDGTHDSSLVLRQYSVQLLQANSRLQADIIAIQAQQDQHIQIATAACAVAVISLLVAARLRWA